MKKLLLFITIIISGMGLFAQVGTETMSTTYDLQSNGFLSNRMYQLKDGSVAVTATFSSSLNDAGFADRGTGYNFYDGSGWNGMPTERIEANATGADMRTGWPSIAPYGAEGEILVNHSTGLNYWIREKAGEGIWDGPYAIPNPENIDEVVGGWNNALAWPRIVTTGENNEVLHIFAAAAGEVATAQYYLRTTDLQNWDVQFAPLEMDDLHIDVYAADDYAVSANGENIAVVYCAGFMSHVMLYESNDAGLTWESRMVWESPIHGLDWETDENTLFETLYGPAHASVAIGVDGVSHVALSVGLYSHSQLGFSYSLYMGIMTDGVAYWNDTTSWNGIVGPIRPSQGDIDSLQYALRLWWPNPEDPDNIVLDVTNFCAWMPPHAENGYNEFDASTQYTGSYAGTAGDYLSSFGLIAYPSIAVDPAGNLAVAYSAPDLNRSLWYDQNGNGYYMRSIFVNYKPVYETSWSGEFTTIGKSLSVEGEAISLTAVSTPVNENEFWFSCLIDDDPGFYTGSNTSQTNITTSTVNAFKFNPEEYTVKVETSVYPSKSGVVTGGNVYFYGENVTLTATPNVGYNFLNWTENGVIVSTDIEYTFSATIDRNLVANFEYVDDGSTRKAIIEVLTGNMDFYSPGAHRVANEIARNYPNRVYPINIYTSYFTSTSYPNLNTIYAQEFESEYNIDAYPIGMVNRTTKYGLSKEQWRSETEQQLSQRADVKIDGKVKIVEDKRIAEITVDLDYVETSIYSTNYLTIMMLQDSIWGSQSGGEYDNAEQYVDGQYCHMHVLRDIITPTWGTAIMPTTAGTSITKKYTYEIPEVIGDPNGAEVDLDNIYFLAFVTERKDGETTCPVLNVNKLSITNTEDFIPESYYWTPDPSLYANDMSLVGLVQIDGVDQDRTSLEVGAFCGDELRGSRMPQYIPALDKYLVFLTIYGEDDDEISFKLYNHKTDEEMDLSSPEPLSFTINGTIGSVNAPHILNFRNSVDVNVIINPAEAGEVSGIGEYLFGDTVTLYATSNEGFSFKNWSVNGMVLSTETWYGFIVTEDIELVANYNYVQSRNLASGWNWYSSYVDMNGEDGLEMMENALGENGLQIKDHTEFVVYSDGYWYGSLVAVSQKKMYMIETSANHTFELFGDKINPEELPITIGTNWNWISYPLNINLSVEDAIGTIVPQTGDYIKSKTAFSQYYEGEGWLGALNTMNPGEGYMYYNTSGTAKTLVYPSESATRSTKANVTAENNYWVPNTGKFAGNMSLIAVVESNGIEMSDYEVAAFVGDEVRGSARPIYIEALDKHMIFMTVYGSGKEEVTFKYYDINANAIENVTSREEIVFSDNATYGSIENAIVLTCGVTGIGENDTETLNIYPNPANVNAEISLGTTYDRVEIYNAIGVKIAEYATVNKIDGIATAGVYLIKVTNDNESRNCRIVIR